MKGQQAVQIQDLHSLKKIREKGLTIAAPHQGVHKVT